MRKENRSHTFITAAESRQRFVKIFVSPPNWPGHAPASRIRARAHPTSTSGSGEIEVPRRARLHGSG